MMRAACCASSSLVAATVLSAAMLLSLPASAQPVGPSHLWWAEDLVTHVTPELNSYGSNPSYVFWAGVDGAIQYENRGVCTTFLTAVLKHAHGWTDSDFKAWFGYASPTSVAYHTAIVAENGFDRIMTAGEIRAGDIMAIEYPSGGSVTGHVAMARGPATLRFSTSPIVAGTIQWELPVADSSSTGHGLTDSRLEPSGLWHAGAGFGVMRLYTDAQGVLVGHSWSTSAGSTYYSLSTRHVVIGRLL